MRTVTFLIGVSASGKSRYAEKLTSGEVVLSSDQIRLELFGNLTKTITTRSRRSFSDYYNQECLNIWNQVSMLF